MRTITNDNGLRVDARDMDEENDRRCENCHAYFPDDEMVPVWLDGDIWWCVYCAE